MGDDVPPDELNHAPRAGLHFGFPYYGGGDAATDLMPGGGAPVPVTMPAVRFGAHVAALGAHFYRGDMFPPQYRGDAFVAQHGSWNRTIPDGYRIARVRFDESGGATWSPFAEGWLTRGQAWGRPVDVKEHWDEFGAKRIILTHFSREMFAMKDEVPEECAHDGLVVEI